METEVQGSPEGQESPSEAKSLHDRIEAISWDKHGGQVVAQAFTRVIDGEWGEAEELRQLLNGEDMPETAPLTITRLIRTRFQTEIEPPLLTLMADLASGGDHTKWLKSGRLAESALADPVVSRSASEPLAVYRRALESTEPEVRTSAALALTFTSRSSRDVTRMWNLVVDEEDRAVAASLVCCIGALAGRLHTGTPNDLPNLQSESGLLGMAAAVACGLAREPMHERGVRALRKYLSRPRPLPGSFVFARGELSPFLLPLLARDAVRRYDGETLCELVDTDPSRASEVLRAVFRDGVDRPRDPTQLSDAIRALLLHLDKAELRVWVDDFAYFGVPLRENMERYLGIRPKGPMDLDVLGSPLWLHAFDAMHDPEARRWWSSLLRGALDPEGVIELVSDALKDDSYLLHPWPPERVSAEGHIRFWAATLAECTTLAAIDNRMEALGRKLGAGRQPNYTELNALTRARVGLLEQEP